MFPRILLLQGKRQAIRGPTVGCSQGSQLLNTLIFVLKPSDATDIMSNFAILQIKNE
jgi:hypothetical protein